jgi:N-methylhydantoinase A/oxoprolinase/acetone carboxylase beta subunit
MSMNSARNTFLIGIDTGGTYTDAAIISQRDYRVVASAKALTTKGDLAVGVGEALQKACATLLGRYAPADISLVSVSTTLATNAVVEGHGSPICVILIGFDVSMAQRSGVGAAFPNMPVVRIEGGHDHNGDEQRPLDEAALAAVIRQHGDTVDAFAVAAQFAVRNPKHEHRARDIIVAKTGKPVTLSCELSMALDAPRRALTAALNARLISPIVRLIDAVRGVMQSLDLTCPLMIAKGDGSLALASTVMHRPIETVLSGPAASLVGARWLSGLDDFIMSDMGGTTTDLAILQGGRPKITEDGADVGGWRTMVKAIEVRTLGLGGDSEIAIATDGSFSIGPQRIVPISLIGAHFPEVITALAAELAEPQIHSLAAKFIMRPLGSKNIAPSAQTMSSRENQILDAVGLRPTPLQKVAASAGAQRAVGSLRRKGLVQIAGFTPSDAAHVLAMQDNWSREAALSAAKLMVRMREMRAPTEQGAQAFAQDVWNDVVALSARAVLDEALGARGLLEDGEGKLLRAVCRANDTIGLAHIRISPTVPVVAVGAPVRVYYGEVGKRLDAHIVFPDFCDVANAVGAAMGSVARTVTVEVTKDSEGVFRIHGPSVTELTSSAKAAVDLATEVARETARQSVLAMGAGEPELRITIEKKVVPDAIDDSAIFAATVTVEAIGRPVQSTLREERRGKAST